jgi:hypothetical protein
MSKRNEWWVIESPKGEIYWASNAKTKSGAIIHHEGSLGVSWDRARREGNKLVKIRITKVRKKKRKIQCRKK